MKRKMLDMSDCKDIVKSSYFCQHFEESDFEGRVCIIKFDEVAKKWKVSDNISILDNQYIWLEFYPYNCNYCFTAMYDNKNNLIEWYIDITKTIKKDNDSYIEDLFIDFVLLPNGDFFILDEEELEDAYSRKIISGIEYKTVLRVKKELTNKLKNINMKELIDFTNKYKEKLIKKI